MKRALVLVLGIGLSACGGPNCARYWGFMEGSTWVHVDPDNGCAWYKSSYSMTPKLNAGGRQVCYAPHECGLAAVKTSASEIVAKGRTP